MIDIDRQPSPHDLRVFAWLLPVFFGLVGAQRWHAGSPRVAAVLWIAGGAISLAVLAIPAVRRGVYAAWMMALFPIAWVVSHVILFAIYALVATPTALVLRALGRDPMQRGFDRGARSYWVRRKPSVDRARYFRQS